MLDWSWTAMPADSFAEHRFNAVPSAELHNICTATALIQKYWRRRKIKPKQEADQHDIHEVNTNWLGFECGFCLAPTTVELLPMFRICQGCVWDSLFEGVESGDETAPTDNSEAMTPSLFAIEDVITHPYVLRCLEPQELPALVPACKNVLQHVYEIMTGFNQECRTDQSLAGGRRDEEYLVCDFLQHVELASVRAVSTKHRYFTA